VTDLEFVLRAVDVLRAEGIRTWVCGGWAEELRVLTPPCEHHELELLYPARDWQRVDALDLHWIEASHEPHTRAFRFEETPVVLLLVERDKCGWFTQRPDGRHDWPADVFASSGWLAVASAAALQGYRRAHAHAA
jgi:hypothetical protein